MFWVQGIIRKWCKHLILVSGISTHVVIDMMIKGDRKWWDNVFVMVHRISYPTMSLVA
jgi:hypothetical protein